MEEGQEWRQYFIAGIGAFSVFVACYSMGWSAPIIIKLGNPDESPLPEPITVDEEAWIGSLITIGAMFGPFISGFIISKLGRKWALITQCLPMLASWALIAVATSLPMIYAARVLGGFYVGMSFTVGPLYLGEIARDSRRGALNASLGVGMSSGFFLAYCIGPFVSYAVVAYVGIVMAGLYFVASLFAPESPYFYLAKDDMESAGLALMKLRGKSCEAVQSELEKLDIEVKESVKNTAKFSDIFRGNNMVSLLLSCGLMMAQQLSGINALQFYMTNIFEAAGTELDSAISTIIIGSVQTVVSLGTPLIIDRLGRRPLLLMSSAAMTVSHSLLGMYFYFEQSGDPVAAKMGFLPILCLVVVMIAHVLGLGPVPIIYAAEVLPAEVRSAAMSLAISYLWICTFLVTRFFGPIAAAVGMGASFWVFSGCCFVSFIYIWFLIPETKGKSLHEIQDMLRRKFASDKSTK